MPAAGETKPRLISTYPRAWTSYYLARRYQRIDPVITEAFSRTEPFEWGLGHSADRYPPASIFLLEEAAAYGIRAGFTVPIHDGHGPPAALTFASDQRITFLNAQSRAIQLIAMYFHAHVRRGVISERVVDGKALSPREVECLEWASQGKSAWEIGSILGISRHTVASHLDSAKEKLGVRTVVQAATRLLAAKQEKRN